MMISLNSQNQEIFTWKLIITGSEFHIESGPQACSSASSLDEISKCLPQGAYTTFRTYDHSRILRPEDHIQRLEDSAARACMPVSIDPSLFRAGLRHIILGSPYPDSRIRVTLDLENEPGNFYVSLEQLHTPSESAYRDGVKVLTRSLHRENAKAKLTGFIDIAASYRASMPADINEILMIGEHDQILEGLSSNFFGIIGGKIYTADEGVLNGITRSSVLEIAASQGLPLGFEGISVHQLPELDECFITSASRAILPVVQIDQVIIHDGKPGPLTRRLLIAFNQWIASVVQEI
jgi:branched-chain amino acid aminotransferase